MRSGVEGKGPFSGEIFKRATAILAGLALALGGCSIGEAGAGASSSPEVTTASATTPTAEATPTPTAERTPKMVAPGELPTVEQLSVENLEKDECLMLVAGAFETEDGTSVSRAIATVDGRLTVFGKEACNGGKVDIKEGDEVRFFAMDWKREPEETGIREVRAKNGKAAIVYTRNGGALMGDSVQGVSFGPEDMTDPRNVVVILRLSDGKLYPLGCESEEVDVQTLARSNDPGICR